MILSAKANHVPVILGRFDSFRPRFEGVGFNGLDKTPQLTSLTEALAVDQDLARIAFSDISMCGDGLHPDQLGYNQMASLAVEKSLSSFPP